MEERFKMVVSEERSLSLMIEEIRLTCINDGVPCTESMAKYALSIVSLDPALAKISRGSPKMIIRVTQNAVNYLTTMKGIRHRLLVAQSLYFEEFRSVDNIINRYRRMLNHQVHPLQQHLMVYDRADPDTEMIFRQIVYMTMLTTGMGDPTVRLNFKEAEAALRSVFSQREVARFVSLTQSRKRKKLQELIRLVTGVRIYNRAKMNPKSSDASYADEISGLPELLFNATITMKERVEESMKRMTLQVTNLERALEECFTWDRKSLGVLNFNSFITDEEVDAAKDVLCLYHQVFQVLTFMLENLHETVQLHLNTEANMRSTVSQMMTKLDCKVGIPRTEVEKDFVELYHNWKFFQGRFVLISEFNRMLKKYNQLCEVPFLPESIAWVLSSPNLFSPSQEEAELNNEYSNNFEISWAEDEGGNVEFAGFDPVWLILTNGILLTGKRKMGLLKFDEKCYAFRDHESAKLFCYSPVECIERVYDFGRRHPAFIDILQLRRGLKENRKFHGVQTRFHSSKSVQCDVHPIATRLVYKYRHSTWSMKQDACQAADLKNKKTLAMQTTLSHMRRSVDTQTYSAVEKESLTSKSEGTSVPKLQNFIYGLRGRREEVQHTVNLTRPIQEGHSEKRPCDALYSDDGNLESGCCRLDCANNGRYKTKMGPCVKFENNNFECSQRELEIEDWSR